MPDSSRVGKVLASKYRLDQELGRGGMGAVYRAFHLGVHKDFAVKVLSAELAEHRTIAQRFLREAQAAGRIGHPGILDVYDVGEDEDGRPFMVMELLRGEALAAHLARGALDVDAACWVALKILEALEAAHKAGVVHRDVKPHNVFIVAASDAEEAPRVVKLLDFGIAKFSEQEASAITRSGEIIGSPLYMAPEQAKGDSAVDARVDLWAVGAVLFEMLTGEAAYKAPTPIAVLAKILTEEAAMPSSRRTKIPPALDEVVRRALRIEKSERFETARQMIDALSAVRASLGTTSVVPSFRAPPVALTVRVGGERSDNAIASTSTVATPEHISPEPGTSIEPPMEAAVTNPARTTPRPRHLLVVLAAAIIVCVATVPWLWHAWTSPNAVASGTGRAPLAETAPALSVLTKAEPVTSNVAPPASVPSAEPSSAPAPAVSSAPSPPRPARGISNPACPPGEVASAGHCCPRGLVWQSARCERPLATSY